MPTYEYACPNGHQFEKFQKMSDKPRARCPVCDEPATRKISGGAGLVFKGTGFYITDYGKDGKGPKKQPEGGDAPKSEPKTETKTEPAAKKAEPKPAKPKAGE